MNLNSLNLKLIIGIAYLVIISIGLYFLFSFVDIKDLTSYEFIRLNKDLILKYNIVRAHEPTKKFAHIIAISCLSNA